MMFAIHVYPYRISVRHKVHFVFKQHEKKKKKFRTNFLLHSNLDGTLVDLSFCFVCVCVYISSATEASLVFKDILDIQECTDQRSCVVGIILDASANFLHFSF